MCTWIGAQAQIDTTRTGGRNPLVDAAQKLSLLGTAGQDEDDDPVRGPRTGYVTHEEGASLMTRSGTSTDTLQVDAEGNVIGVRAGTSEEVIPEGAAEPRAGSYEAFMGMFGAGGTPPPQGPPPPSAPPEPQPQQ